MNLRSIHVNLSMMHLFVPALDQQPVMPSLVGGPERLVITYDIICQWSKNFQKRMKIYPENMRILETMQVEVAIPGWHINGHGEGCQTNFNLSYMEGAGRTVGEDIETTWAGTNQLVPSVREMGPAARHDTLNDQWNGWNFRKIVGFHKSFFSLQFIPILTVFRHQELCF
ncbi:uncharacterized protein LACBIDRAFT_308171 [Laccaria bicolor S238N-H82]|uniref:Predicted protein n=1 Tax=Laccaria bicolor (strain S238N-H82 / ATCC MYA-4686) TaxID=486041 RepID=B0DRR9_LACBS|nr:uncharacterized protein LACBIDRAFT_308171 [Laccaria bicolor S238N-H82]EDR02657.1 predicted protein [Laccaria bicolor S238N-H82]|eukprot:XP_001886701.1 predicted protein [Laccaria bicolor S238N-H82]